MPGNFNHPIPEGERERQMVQDIALLRADLATARAKLRKAEEALDVETLVNRFLAWPLPKSVLPDPCVMDQDYPHRSGTNLLTADEARQMFRHCIEEPEK